MIRQPFSGAVLPSANVLNDYGVTPLYETVVLFDAVAFAVRRAYQDGRDPAGERPRRYSRGIQEPVRDDGAGQIDVRGQLFAV